MADDITRVLTCNDCRSIEALPDFEGQAENDILLARLLEGHRFADGSEHFGRMFRIESKHWDSPSTREEVIRRIHDETGHTGLDSDFYSLRDNLQYDALRCFSEHHRNANCSDYKDRKKLITPDTKAERKEAGLAKYTPEANPRYLCEFCPVHSLVVESLRWKAGQYK